MLTISAKPELELRGATTLEPPRLPALAAAGAARPLPEPLDDEPLEEDELPDPPADTASPGVRLDSEAIVPLTGAYSLVLLSAASALWTPAWAEYTAAWAEAMLAGEGVVVVVVVVGVEVVLAARSRAAARGRRGVVLGTTTVTVTLGVVLVVIIVPDRSWACPTCAVPGDRYACVVPVPGWNAAYSDGAGRGRVARRGR